MDRDFGGEAVVESTPTRVVRGPGSDMGHAGCPDSKIQEFL